LNWRPAEPLRLSRLAKTALKPTANPWMKILKRHGMFFYFFWSVKSNLVRAMA